MEIKTDKYNTKYLAFCKRNDASKWETEKSSGEDDGDSDDAVGMKKRKGRASRSDDSEDESGSESEGDDDAKTRSRAAYRDFFRRGSSRSPSPNRRSKKESNSPKRKDKVVLSALISSKKSAEQVYICLDDAPSKISSAFRLFDKKGRGYVTQTHFRKVIAKLKIKGVTDDDADLLASCFDVNGDGKISYAEFERYMRPTLEDRLLRVVDIVRQSFAHMLQLKVEGAWLCDRFFQSWM